MFDPMAILLRKTSLLFTNLAEKAANVRMFPAKTHPEN
jgi:hypothetical protein